MLPCDAGFESKASLLCVCVCVCVWLVHLVLEEEPNRQTVFRDEAEVSQCPVYQEQFV